MKLNQLLAVFLLLLVFTSCAPPPEVAGASREMTPQAFMLNTVLFFAMALFGYSWLVVRPEAKKQEEHKKFIDGLQKNQQVATTGGIFGKLISIKEGVATVEIASNTKVKVSSAHLIPAEKLKVPTEEKT